MRDKIWYETSYRRNLVDMHIDDWDERFLSKLEPEEYVRLLKKARVQSAMVYANSHVGYCYWPTKTGRMHRGIRGRDVLGDIIALCHGEGMDVVPYYSLIFNNWAYDHDPSWRMIDVNGKASRDPGRWVGAFGGRYGICCPNSASYRRFVAAQVKELCAGYDFEGIFFDMTFWPAVCYCRSCRERFAGEVGGEMPTVIDWSDPRWLTFQKKREEWLVEFAAFATGTARRCKPGVSVEHNSAVLTQNWRLGTTLGLAEQNDYIGGDLYGGFGQQSFICKMYDSITPNRPFEFMTSRCSPGLQDHTTLKSRETLELHACTALAHNGAFLFIDAIDPAGTLNPKVYEIMGQVFGESQKYEPYLGGERCEDVGVFFSLDSKIDLADNGKPVAQAGWRVPHLDAALGAAAVLRENHIPHGVMSAGNLPDASAHQVIVLPDLPMLSEREVEDLMRFVADGGGLYASGQTSPALVGEVFGVSFEGETSEAVTYMAPTAKGQPLMAGIEPGYPLSVSGRQMMARALDGGDVVATLTLPYTDPADATKLASIHSNPPGVPTDYCAATLRLYGKGKAAWLSAPIEAVAQEPHRRFLAQIVRELAGRPFSFRTDAPAAVEVVVSHQADRKRYLISLLNEQDRMPPIPVSDATVAIRMEGKKAVRVVLLPDEQPLAFEVRGAELEIAVPRLEIFCMLMVEYE